MYEHLTYEQLRTALSNHKQAVRDNPGDAENSEYHAPAIHYMQEELKQRSIQEERV